MIALVFTARSGRFNRAWLTVRAPSFFIARAFARVALETDDLGDVNVRVDPRPRDVELRFVGNAYSHGGTPLGLRLVVREARRLRVDSLAGGRSMTRVLRIRDEHGREQFWTGDRWSYARDSAKEYGSMHEANDARKWIDSDRDILIVHERRRTGASDEYLGTDARSPLDRDKPGTVGRERRRRVRTGGGEA